MSSRGVLEITSISKMSAWKNGFIVSVVTSIASFIAISLIYLMLDGMGAVADFNAVMEELFQHTVNFGFILIAAGLIVLANLIFVPLIAVVVAIMCNLSFAIVGGLVVGVEVKDVDN